MLQEIWRRIRYTFGNDPNTALDEEMQLHLSMRAEQLQAQGWSREEAMREARRRFGSPLHLRERSNEIWISQWIAGVGRDIRLALRALAKKPGFTATAVLTLAIGMGANTAVFSVLNSVLLKPLAYPEPQQLVAVSNKAPGAQGLTTGSGDLLLSISMYVTFSEQNRTFESFGIWGTGSGNVTSPGEPEQVRTVAVSDGVLRALGVAPMLGTGFMAEDHRPGGPRKVMLSHGYWQRRFGGNRSVIGSKLVADSAAVEVVGVMPPGFRVANTEADLIVPFRFNRAQLLLPGFGFQAVGRLKPGVDLAAASADIARLIPVWLRSWPTLPGIDPTIYDGWRLSPYLRPLQQEVVGNVSQVLWLVMATIGVVMVIAAANVASLLLVRSESRHNELATKAALGAGWPRIVREMLVESVLLGLMGGIVGLGFASAAIRYLLAAGPAMLPRLHEVSLDATAIWFTVGVSILTGLMAGLLPALRYLRGTADQSIRVAGRTASVTRERRRLQNTLVAGQVALAVVLLVSAGLIIRTFRALQHVELGFAAPHRIQTARISVSGSFDQVIRAQRNILERLQAMPEAESVAFVSEAPLDGRGRDWDAVCQEGQGLERGAIPPVRTYKSISPGLFRTMGTRLVAGRDLTWTEVLDRRRVLLLSENMARELYGSPTAAIGKLVGSCIPGSRKSEVIGVVQDVRDKAVEASAPAIVYWPPFVEDSFRNVARDVTLMIRMRTAGSEGLMQQVTQAVWSVDRAIPVGAVTTMQGIVDQSMASTSFALVMLGIAGMMALLLGCIGIYGVVSYSVSRRRREMGIRLALGANPGAIQARIVSDAVVLTGVGVAVGLVAASGLTRLMQALLFGTSPFDALTFGTVAVILLAAAMVASYLPARRVAAVDPVEALRADC